jgi:hypothetical protein
VTRVSHRSSQRSPSPVVTHSPDSAPMSSNIAHLLTTPQDKAIPPRHRSRCIDLPHRTVVVRASGSFPEQQLPLAASVSLKTRRCFRKIPFAVDYCSFTRGLLWAYWESCWRSPKASANAMKFSGRRGGPFQGLTRRHRTFG